MCKSTFDLSQRYGVSQCILSKVELLYTGDVKAGFTVNLCFS